MKRLVSGSSAAAGRRGELRWRGQAKRTQGGERLNGRQTSLSPLNRRPAILQMGRPVARVSAARSTARICQRHHHHVVPARLAPLQCESHVGISNPQPERARVSDSIGMPKSGSAFCSKDPAGAGFRSPADQHHCPLAR